MKPRDQIRSRMYVVLTLVSLVPALVAFRLVGIHVGEGSALRAEGARQASSFVELPALRGTITDRAGRVLATATARYDLALDPTAEGFGPAADAFYARLADLTGTPASAFRRAVRDRRSPQYVVLRRGLTERQKEALDALAVPGAMLTGHYARRYTYGEALAHALGHVGRDGHGLAGLEVRYDTFLTGIAGRRPVQRDRSGRVKPVVGARVEEPRHGQTLVLTVDLIRQTMLEEELAKGVAETGGQWATAIAMDPHTGAVLALANVPTYDPNRPGAFDEFHRRNHAITDQIEPGSTFKLVVAAAAVEGGKVRLEEAIPTGDGWAVFGGRTLRDDHALGTVSFADVIAHSSNVGTARVAQRVGREPFYARARALGFGQVTTIDLPGETAGRLKRPDRWSGTTLTSMSIGYEVAVTPLQLLAAYCALANGGLLVRPYLVAERRDVTGRVVFSAGRDSVRRAFSAATARALVPAFERAVAEGTAKKARIDGLPVAGKTGTARKSGAGGYTGGYRSSFVGFFPADDPQVALVVVVDEARAGIYGGEIAAPIFQRIAQRWIGTLPRVAERLAPVRPFPRPGPALVPAIGGAPVRLAAQRILAAGLRTPTLDPARSARTVAAQTPAAGAAVDAGATVRLVATGARATTMPDLAGLSARQARAWLAGLGVRARIEGAGAVHAQQPRAGSPLPTSAVVHLR